MQFAPEPAMSAWSCPHDLDGICQRVRGAICSPGMRGCELEGKVRFALDEFNEPRKPVKARPAETRPEPKPGAAAAPRRRLPF
jgi:hypothetical protein